jgi:hypothetical protein
MRDYLSGVIRRPGPANTPTAGGDADEREWEKLLKQSDRLDTAYREAIEKYRDDPDSDQKEAFVMGWDSLLGAMAEQKSCPDRNDDAWQDDESPGFPDDPDTREAPGDGDDDDASSFESLPTAETEDPHPLRELAGELAMRAYDLVANQEPKSESGHRLVSNMMQVSGKLAGALMATGSDYRPETGFVLAILKRCLQFINDAMSGCQELILAEEDPDHKHALEALLQDIFEIRGQIVELRRELREN